MRMFNGRLGVWYCELASEYIIHLIGRSFHVFGYFPLTFFFPLSHFGPLAFLVMSPWSQATTPSLLPTFHTIWSCGLGHLSRTVSILVRKLSQLRCVHPRTHAFDSGDEKLRE